MSTPATENRKTTLDPVALARMGIHAAAHEPVALAAVLGAGVVAECVTALEQGRDADAAWVLGAALGAHAVPAPVGSPLEALTPVLRSVVERRGLVRASDLARQADLAVGVLHREVVTPLDIERTVGLSEGNIFAGEFLAPQMFFFRPAPGWSQYRTPIAGYYQCGSGTHPGGCVIGSPGRLASQRILRDLAD